MIISLSKAGLSFKGAYLYLMHDVKSSTRERVDWTQTENMLTQNPDRSWKVMTYTALAQDRLKEASGMSRVGRKTQRPALTFSLSWHPEQNPNKEEMLSAAQRAIAALDLSEHEALIVAHKDTPHKHVHVLINRIHPVSGRASTLSHSKRQLSALSHKLELEGGKIYCEQRKDNLEMQQEGISTRYRDPIIQSAWDTSNNGKEFMAALAVKSYFLAQGRKRLVVVDAHGKIHNPTRHLQSIRAKEFRAKLEDIDLNTLRDAEEIAKEITQHKDGQSRQDQQYQKEATQALNDMQTRHFDEHGELMDRHSRIILREKEKLIAFYNFKEKETTIRELETKCEKPNWWRSLLGFARKDREQLELLKKSLESGKGRYTERISTLENKAQKEIEQLKMQQLHERENLVDLIAQSRPLRQNPQIEWTAETNLQKERQIDLDRGSAPQLRF